MELQQIETYLGSPDPQNRMKAITELRHHDPVIVVPLLKRCLCDKEFIIRSFVAIGLGHKRTEEAFLALVELIQYDKDTLVRAEAANSLARYGDRALPYLVELFEQESHWLVRQSILAALSGMDYPDILLKLCRIALTGDDRIVKQAAIANLGELGDTAIAPEALDLLLENATSEVAEIRGQVAQSLRQFESDRAKAALIELRQDSDYRVIGATLEGLLNS